jgi:hypothetical protein
VKATFHIKFQNNSNDFQNGSLQVSVGGRVMTADGRGIRNAHVTLTAPDDETRPVMTAAFGYYRFENVIVGEVYVISVAAKRFTFSRPTQVRFISEEINDVNFIADF